MAAIVVESVYRPSHDGFYLAYCTRQVATQRITTMPGNFEKPSLAPGAMPTNSSDVCQTGPVGSSVASDTSNTTWIPYLASDVAIRCVPANGNFPHVNRRYSTADGAETEQRTEKMHQENEYTM